MYPLYTLTALLFSSVLLCTGCDGQEDPTTSEQSDSEDSPAGSPNNTKQSTPNKPANSIKPSPPRSPGNTTQGAGQGDGSKQFTEDQEKQKEIAKRATTLFRQKQQKREGLIAKMKAMALGNYTNGTIKDEMGTLQKAENDSKINTLLTKAKEKAIGNTAQGEYYKVVKQVCEAFLIEAGGNYKEATEALKKLPGLAAAYDKG